MKSKAWELIVTVELEKSKLNREKALILVDKGLLLYFSFLFIAVLGFLNGYIDVRVLNTMVLMSFGVLIVAITPYLITMRKEESRLDDLLSKLKGGKRV